MYVIKLCKSKLLQILGVTNGVIVSLVFLGVIPVHLIKTGEKIYLVIFL